MTTGPTFNRVGARCCRTTDADGSWGVAPSWRRSTRCSTARRHPVFVGRGFELERELPFAIWVDALDDHVATLGERRLEGLVGDRVGELARVLPAAGARPPGGVQDQRFHAYRAVRALLQGLALRGPVLLVLDDVHWADDASLELIAHLLRRPPAGAVLI